MWRNYINSRFQKARVSKYVCIDILSKYNTRSAITWLPLLKSEQWHNFNFRTPRISSCGSCRPIVMPPSLTNVLYNCPIIFIYLRGLHQSNLSTHYGSLTLSNIYLSFDICFETSWTSCVLSKFYNSLLSFIFSLFIMCGISHNREVPWKSRKTISTSNQQYGRIPELDGGRERQWSSGRGDFLEPRGVQVFIQNFEKSNLKLFNLVNTIWSKTLKEITTCLRACSIAHIHVKNNSEIIDLRKLLNFAEV